MVAQSDGPRGSPPRPLCCEADCIGQVQGHHCCQYWPAVWLSQCCIWYVDLYEIGQSKFLTKTKQPWKQLHVCLFNATTTTTKQKSFFLITACVERVWRAFALCFVWLVASCGPHLGVCSRRNQTPSAASRPWAWHVELHPQTLQTRQSHCCLNLMSRGSSDFTSDSTFTSSFLSSSFAVACLTAVSLAEAGWAPSSRCRLQASKASGGVTGAGTPAVFCTLALVDADDVEGAERFASNDSKFFQLSLSHFFKKSSSPILHFELESCCGRSWRGAQLLLW